VKNDTTSESHDWFLAIAARFFNIVFVFGGVASFLALAYVVYHYAWTGERQILGRTGLLYYITPCLIGVGLCCCLALKPRYKVDLGLIFISLGLSLWLGELVLRFTRTSPRVYLPVMSALAASKKDREKDAAKVAKQFAMSIDI